MKAEKRAGLSLREPLGIIVKERTAIRIHWRVRNITRMKINPMGSLMADERSTGNRMKSKTFASESTKLNGLDTIRFGFKTDAGDKRDARSVAQSLFLRANVRNSFA